MSLDKIFISYRGSERCSCLCVNQNIFKYTVNALACLIGTCMYVSVRPQNLAHCYLVLGFEGRMNMKKYTWKRTGTKRQMHLGGSVVKAGVN